MRVPIDRGTAGIGALVGLVLVCTALSFDSARTLRAETARVDHSRRVLDAVAGVRSDGRKLQVAQQASIISPKEEAVADMTEAEAVVRAHLTDLAALTAGGRADQADRAAE